MSATNYLMNIFYRDNTERLLYDKETHHPVSNWDPNKDYGGEYVQVYFRVRSKGYSHPSFAFEAKDRAAFECCISKVFSTLGFTSKDHDGRIATCSTVRRCVYVPNFPDCPDESLYLHPQEFSGIVLKNNIREIAEALSAIKSPVRLEMVDLYDTFSTLPDEQYEKYLVTQYPRARQFALELSKTSRTNKYVSRDALVARVASQIKIKRVVDIKARDNCEPFSTRFVNSLVDTLISEGYLIACEGGAYVRAANKTEQRKLPNRSIDMAQTYMNNMAQAATGKLENPDIPMYCGLDGHRRFARECGPALSDFDKEGQDHILHASYSTIYVRACNLKPILTSSEWVESLREGWQN